MFPGTCANLCAATPLRVPLQARQMKRCPSCRHTLVQPQPDAKSVRMPIKMVAFNYLPTLELGRRRRRISDELDEHATDEELEKKRRERRRTRLPPGREDDEDMSAPLWPGEVVTICQPLLVVLTAVLVPAGIHQPALRSDPDPSGGCAPAQSPRAFQPPHLYPFCPLYGRRAQGCVGVRRRGRGRSRKRRCGRRRRSSQRAHEPRGASAPWP